jgi:murein DD-endopeptidase MepM/ murein hydrolase activator NlpD
MKKNFLSILFFLFFFKLNATEFKGSFAQGNLIIGKTEVNNFVYIDKKKIKVNQEGYFAFGIDRDRKNDIRIKIVNKEKTENIVKKVYKKKYQIQKIDGLPQKQVTPPKEVYERIKSDNKLIASARAVDSDLNFFTNKFIVPIENPIISGVYGSQRILNGIPKSPHYGVDFAADEGTPIKNMLEGVVTLSEKDLYYTGGTVIVDHGHGISTLYMHMKDVNVSKGQSIKQGDLIGTVGKTGRSTGPHLHIQLHWYDMKLDPASVLNLN